MRRKRDLIVPIHDRRKGKRYLTLKNFGVATVAFTVLFAGVHVLSELRGTSADYGRLMNRELPSEPIHTKPVEVVTEAAPPPVPDATHADPLLVEPMVRGQWLQGDPQGALTTAEPAASHGMPMQRAEASVATGETRVAIVGGIEGVNVVKRERTKPVLSGGFGR
jgi:hypothetical protein